MRPYVLMAFSTTPTLSSLFIVVFCAAARSSTVRPLMRTVDEWDKMLVGWLLSRTLLPVQK